MILSLFVALAAFAFAQCAPQGDPPLRISLMIPNGIRFELSGASVHAVYYHIHFNVNSPLRGVSSGQHNSPNIGLQGGWVYEEPLANVQPGDVVYYWIQVHYQDSSVDQWTEKQWVAPPRPTTRPAPTTTTTTTPSPSTATPSTSTKDAAKTTAQPKPVKATSFVKPDGCHSYPCLIFEDEFETLNFSVWEHEITLGGGGNWEFEYYLNNRSNSYARDGNLFIKPTLTADRLGEQYLSTKSLDIWGNQPADVCTGNSFYGCFRQGTGTNYINPIQSARIRSVRSFNFKYGKIEFKVKMPAGDWIWPALWLLPTRQEYGLWPASGEIDIAEVRGNRGLRDKNGKEIGIKNVGQTLHWGPYYPVDPYEKTHVDKDAATGTFASDYHTFGAEWDEEHLSFFVDGEETKNINPGPDGFWAFGEFDKNLAGSDNPWKQPGSNKMAPFDKEFYVVMNVAVGGTNGFFPDDAVNVGSGKPWTNKEQVAMRDFWNARNQWYPTWNPDKNNGEDAAMKVDYVKVWKLKPDQ